MATKPKIVTLSNNSVDVLNAIRNSASINYRDYVPIATADADSIREIGATIMDYPALQNEFLNALVNRIGRVILTSKSYQNPWAMFKKGFLEFGETIEEVFTNLAKPFQFDPAVAENEIFKREIPDVRSAFHVLNYQKFYKATVSQEQLRMAFMSWDGVTSLISSIVESMYTAANYDEFITMKYLLCKRILSGEMYWATPSDMALEVKEIVKSIRKNSDNLTFLSPKYNIAGVYNSTEKNNQYIIIPTSTMAEIDVEVLAAAFNMDKVEFMGHVVTVDSFTDIDTARLRELFKDDPTYTEFSAGDLEMLGLVAAVLVDKDFFMIFDNLQNFTENYNGQGLYWNYFYHVWKTFSTSPYANAILFTSGGSDDWSGASISVTPSAATVLPGQSVQLEANITRLPVPFLSKAIDWESSSEYATVNKNGVVTVLANAAKGTTITITAKAHANPTTKGTATITVG